MVPGRPPGVNSQSPRHDTRFDDPGRPAAGRPTADVGACPVNSETFVNSPKIPFRFLVPRDDQRTTPKPNGAVSLDRPRPLPSQFRTWRLSMPAWMRLGWGVVALGWVLGSQSQAGPISVSDGFFGQTSRGAGR